METNRGSCPSSAKEPKHGEEDSQLLVGASSDAVVGRYWGDSVFSLAFFQRGVVLTWMWRTKCIPQLV